MQLRSAIIVLALVTGLFAPTLGAAGIAIIPQPLKPKKEAGSFTLNDKTAIVAPAEGPGSIH
jgi:hypothetical protein